MDHQSRHRDFSYVFSQRILCYNCLSTVEQAIDIIIGSNSIRHMMEFSSHTSKLPDSVSMTFAIVLIIITVLSSIFSSIIPIMHFVFGRCQSHPTRLIAIICLIDLILGYNLVLIALNIYNIESGIHIQEIYSLLTFHFKFHPGDVGFCTLNLSLFVILESLSLCFNICLAFDLIITLTKPFLAGKSRQMFYYLFAILATSFSFIGVVKQIQNQCIQEQQDTDIIISDFGFSVLLLQNRYPLVGMMLLFQATALFTVIWALIELYSKKKNIEAKKAYIKQHVWILVTLMSCFVFPCLNNFFDILQTDIVSRSYIRNISFISLLVSGSFVNFVRLNDKYMQKNLKFIWKKVRKCNFKIQVEDQSLIDAWNGSLNDLVTQFQNESIIQNILFVVEEVSRIEEVEEQLGSTVVMKREDLDVFLVRRQKSQLAKAAKLKKKVQTWCVQYGEADTSQFRKTVINFGSVSRRKGLQQSNHFKIKAVALAHYVFQKIRLLDGLSNEQLCNSLDLEKNIESIKQTKQSLGASGSFFFFTFDKKLVIKTITSQEEECILSFLPQYYIHLCQNPNTVLSKIYGVYNVQIGNTSKITFLLMQNSFYTFDSKNIEYQIFDMKGSLFNREVKNPNASVLKDVNFLKQSQSFIFMTKQEKKQFLKQVGDDIFMLASQNIMDYSLLLGVTTIDQSKHQKGLPKKLSKWKWMNSGSHLDQRVYSISIIDYLQKFNCQKYLQLKYKTFFSSNLNVSSIDAQKYLSRYLKFLDNIIVVIND